MLDLFGNHIVGFPTRRLKLSEVARSEETQRNAVFCFVCITIHMINAVTELNGY